MKFLKMSNLMAILMMFALLIIGTLPAQAVGTTALSDILNALDTDTTPLSAGQMSVKWTNGTGFDTQYADSAGQLATTVDTGYDMTVLSDTLTPGASQGLTPGDSVVYAIPIRNLGNNASAIPFSHHHLVKSDSTATHDTFTLELYVENGEIGAGAFDPSTATALTASSDAVLFNENEEKTLFAVVTADVNAADGDTLVTSFLATDNAPLVGASTTGDLWERGQPIVGDDTYDTQYLFFTTSVSGPVLEIEKSLALTSGRGRPGDTVEYTITVSNTGGDTAVNVDVVDAMPQYTTYVTGTADAGNTANGNTIFAAQYENTLGGEAFADGESTDAEKILWEVDAIGPTGELNDSVVITFSVTID
jgi:uncharacterized repeat protein (TIGR01451 family)